MFSVNLSMVFTIYLQVLIKEIVIQITGEHHLGEVRPKS